jgi:hypothetical protein
MGLSFQHRNFVDAYIETDGNGAEAARIAGYSEKRARQTANDLLRRDDVSEAIERRRPDLLERIQAKAETEKVGSVYVVEAPAVGRQKIGHTLRDPLVRLRGLQNGSPVLLELRCSFDASPEIETRLHKRFADRRLHGEWFELTEEQIVWVAETHDAERYRPPKTA